MHCNILFCDISLHANINENDVTLPLHYYAMTCASYPMRNLPLEMCAMPGMPITYQKRTSLYRPPGVRISSGQPSLGMGLYMSCITIANTPKNTMTTCQVCFHGLSSPGPLFAKMIVAQHKYAGWRLVGRVFVTICFL